MSEALENIREINYVAFDCDSKVTLAEYVWIDGQGKCRSKTKVDQSVSSTPQGLQEGYQERGRLGVVDLRWLELLSGDYQRFRDIHETCLYVPRSL